MKTIIFNYSPTLIEKISGFHIVVIFHDVASLMQNYLSCQQQNHVDAFLLDMPLSSLSQIDFNEMWEEINSPLVLRVYNIGDLDSVFHRLELLKKLEMRVFLSSTFEDNYYGLKILSSLGVDCGLHIQHGKPISDELLTDLASYYYMSPVPHAKIEPFDYIATRITDEKNLSFNHVYFKDDSYYTFLDEELKLHSSETCKYICLLSEYDEEKEYEQSVSQKMDTYYSHFLDLDKCSKCNAFRICSGMMDGLLANCEETMSACLEDCLVLHKMQKQNTY